MSELEILSGNMRQGLSNILLNILLILAFNVKSNNNEKIIIYFPEERYDFFMDFCKKINNSKLETRNVIEYKGINTLRTLKNYSHSYRGKLHNIIKKDNAELFTEFRIGWSFLPINVLKKSLQYFQIKFNDHIQQKSQSIKKDKGKYIAIHVRTTDWPEYNKYNENNRENYFIPYYEFIDNYKDFNIYLSTDSFETQNIFKKKYKKRIFYYQDISPKYVYRKRFVSGESIYIDYMCCRDAEYFFPTINSTFSNFIKLLRFGKKENL
jgi:hypothetical protein